MLPTPGPRRYAGWLAIPALLAMLALVGVAISTESRDEFEDRTETEEPGDQRPSDQNATGQPPTEGSGTPQEQAQPPTADDRPAEPQGDGEGEGQSITIQTADGEVLIQLDENGQPVQLTPTGEGEVGPGRTLSPDDAGEFGGVRVTEDGRLEPIDQPQPNGRDFGLEPIPGGVEVTRPDGSIVTLEPNGEGGLGGTDSAPGAGGTAQTTDDGDVLVQPGTDFPGQQTGAADAEPLVLETDAGPVQLDLEPDGDLVATQPTTGQPIEIDPEDLVAIRVNEDGQFEVVPLDEIGPDDTVLVPADGGLDLVRPDGSRVEFRADGENDGITATEITADGEETELVPNPDGTVTLSDGTTVGPIDIAEDGGAIERLIDQTSELPWPWVFGAIALLAALSIGTALYLHRTRPNDTIDYSQFAAEGVTVDEFEEFLRVLAADEDPARAIRLAFYAAERGLAGLPPRRQTETPFEWHHRVSTVRPDLADALAPICDRFALVRFAPGQATAADRDAVVAQLRALYRAAAEPADQRADALAGAR
ncbi:MAG: DUF4129 domain-containing protein [Actinomycetota bacterium]